MRVYTVSLTATLKLLPSGTPAANPKNKPIKQ